MCIATRAVRWHPSGWRGKKTGLVLEIRDRGCGVSEKDAENTGVGIAGMRERLAHLGGTLVVESNHPGVAIIAPAVRSLMIENRTRILLADDHELVRRGLRHIT